MLPTGTDGSKRHHRHNFPSSSFIHIKDWNIILFPLVSAYRPGKQIPLGESFKELTLLSHVGRFSQYENLIWDSGELGLCSRNRRSED